MPSKAIAIPPEQLNSLILFVRGQRVILDADIAALYQVSVGALNQAVRRNKDRFPADFVFQLSGDDAAAISAEGTSTSLKSPSVISNVPALRSQIVTSRTGRGGRRHLPFAFTEEGIAMLSRVLRSRCAIAVNIEIMRAFVRLRHMLAGHRELAPKVDELEKRYDKNFSVVFDAPRALMEPPPEPKKPRIGFQPPEGRA